MATPKQAIEVPLSEKIADEAGNITYPWLQFFGQIALGGEKLRDGAEAMNTLTSASTATETINSVEALRAKIQEIT